MDFWSRMLSGIADTILPKALEEDALLLQMEEALQEAIRAAKRAGMPEKELKEMMTLLLKMEEQE